MPDYRRYRVPGGTYFFTVNLLERYPNDLLIRYIGVLRNVVWEHAIRDDTDYAAHVDYCHINPVKHTQVSRVLDWPYSTFHRYVERGIYPVTWGGGFEIDAGGKRV